MGALLFCISLEETGKQVFSHYHCKEKLFFFFYFDERPG